MAQAPLQQTSPLQNTRAPGRWWKIETESTESVDDIRTRFITLFASAGSPAGAALFCDHVILPCTSLLFTPQAVALAETLLAAHGGAACEDPTEGIFLAGNDEDRNRLPVPDLTMAAAQ
jgi:hypothetical protein